MSSQFDLIKEESSSKCCISHCSLWRLLLLSAGVAGVSIAIGVIIGHFTYPVPSLCLGDDVPNKIIEDATPGITDRIKQLMSADSISEFHRRYTLYPHLSGTEGEDKLATEIYETWQEQGLDHVTTDTYDVLLSYPNRSDPNFVFLYDDSGAEVYRTQEFEKILSPDQNHSDVVPPFNAYSPPGDVSGSLVYVNYGRIEDYDVLTSLGISVNNSLVIARYGAIFRGNKVKIAASYGALGVILYSDPADVSIDPNVPVYPDSWWLPGTGVQRGSVLPITIGDPLTPGYPSTASAYRLSEDDAQLPAIPVHPIGYDDAYHFLSIIGGTVAPADWRGGLNFTYHIGPGFRDEYANWTVRVHVATYNERRNTTNVIGYITGSVEPGPTDSGGTCMIPSCNVISSGTEPVEKLLGSHQRDCDCAYSGPWGRTPLVLAIVATA